LCQLKRTALSLLGARRGAARLSTSRRDLAKPEKGAFFDADQGSLFNAD